MRFFMFLRYGESVKQHKNSALQIEYTMKKCQWVKRAFGSAFSIIGSVIGAGFITGREILTFFYGQSPIWVFILLLAFFFLLMFSVMTVKGEMSLYAVERADNVICLFNILMIASMLGATESLARDMGVGCAFPAWSVVMLLVSIVVCAGGMSRLDKFNAVLVSVMLGIVFVIVALKLPSVSLEFSAAGMHVNFFAVAKYVGMNILLTQPLLGNIRRENNAFGQVETTVKTSVLTAFAAAFLLSLTAAAFLAVLPKESAFAELPILHIVGANKVFYYSVSLTVGLGIITTLVGSMYPLLNYSFFAKSAGEISATKAERKENRGDAKKRRRGKIIRAVCICMLSLGVSRLGFYVIVDKIYPLLGVLSLAYYLFTFAVLPIFQRVTRRRTLRRQEYTKARYRSLPDRV